MTAMHSRHIIYLLAATAIAVLQTSCCKDKVEDEFEIVMSASLSETRGLIASADAMKAESIAKGTGFGVYGYKTSNERDQLIFPDTKVAVTDGDWTYTPKKFWDKSAYYHFVAYWPHGLSTSHNLTNHTMTINDVPNWQNASGDAVSDILVAYSQKSAVNYLNENRGEVPFSFKHLLAQVIIKAWYFGNEDNKPYIKELTIGSAEKPVASKSGTTKIDCLYDGSTEHPTSYSGPSVSGEKTLMKNASGDAVEQYFETDVAGKDSPLRTTMCTWLVAPFGTELSTSVPIFIEYQFGAEGSKQTKDGEVPLGHLEAGNSYILTLRFDTSGEKLNLEAIVVQKWLPGADIDKAVYNW